MSITVSNKMQNMKPSAIREIFKSLGTPGAISFAGGNPAPESFPVDAIAAIAADILKTNATAALQYSVTEGYPVLRALVADRLKAKFAIDTDNNTTIIISGGQQAIELACKVLCNEGDEVICENPSFIGALNAFRSLGTKLVGVELESDGIDVAALEQTLKTHPKARMLYLIPTFHNPAGITMSLEKRRAVYALARQYDLVILEDNPYGDLRFAGEELPTLKSMDEDGRVIYCGTFSKILSAGMRVGYACGCDQLVQKMVVAKQVEDVHTNIFFQMVCAQYMQQYDLDAHIATIRELYRTKCERMLKALDAYMPSQVTYTRPEGGLFLWCTLPKGSNVAALIKEAAENKIFVVSGTAFNCDENAPTDSFRLNYSMPSLDDIDNGIQKLGEIVRRYLG